MFNWQSLLYLIRPSTYQSSLDSQRSWILACHQLRMRFLLSLQTTSSSHSLHYVVSSSLSLSQPYFWMHFHRRKGILVILFYHPCWYHIGWKVQQYDHHLVMASHQYSLLWIECMFLWSLLLPHLNKARTILWR
jgi:hypothetical protein